MVDGAIASKAGFVAVATGADPDNRPPEADFNWHCDQLVCQLTDATSDPDGTVSAWSWQFGDGNGSDQTNPLHAYVAPGTYTVTLTVSDNGGATAQTSTDIEVSAAPPPPSNEPPRAAARRRGARVAGVRASPHVAGVARSDGNGARAALSRDDLDQQRTDHRLPRPRRRIRGWPARRTSSSTTSG